MRFSLHFNRLDGAAAAAADLETSMNFKRLLTGRPIVACAGSIGAVGALAGVLLLADVRAGYAADQFPFDRELLLDAAPMQPVKRVPILTVAPDGNATIDLWCRTVRASVQLSDSAIRVEPGPLPENLPQYMSAGQCTSQRMQADADMLAALAQVTAWRKQGRAVVLAGPTTLRFRPSDH